MFCHNVILVLMIPFIAMSLQCTKLNITLARCGDPQMSALQLLVTVALPGGPNTGAASLAHSINPAYDILDLSPPPPPSPVVHFCHLRS